MIEYKILPNNASYRLATTETELNRWGEEDWEVCGVTSEHIFLKRHIYETKITSEWKVEEKIQYPEDSSVFPTFIPDWATVETA